MRLLIGLLMVLFLVGSALAVPVTIDKVEVDDVEVSVNGNNRFDVTRDDTIEVEVLLTATQDTEVELEVFMSGFEYNDVSPLSASTTLFTMDANETVKKTLPIKIDQDVEEDGYKLRVLITDRDGEAVLQNYNLKIDVERHDLKIEDVVITPSGVVTAGQAVLATVRVENQGEKDEDDVRVDFAIPALGISGSDYIDEIESDDEEETEEIFMRVPLCAESGVYDAEVTVTYDEAHRTERQLSRVRVDANPMCQDTDDDEVEVVVEAAAKPLDDANAEVVDPVETGSSKSKVRKALETLVIILVGLLVIVALVIGFNKLKEDEEEEY